MSAGAIAFHVLCLSCQTSEGDKERRGCTGRCSGADVIQLLMSERQSDGVRLLVNVGGDVGVRE
jgi:hypothetical protein